MEKSGIVESAAYIIGLHQKSFGFIASKEIQ